MCLLWLVLVEDLIERVFILGGLAHTRVEEGCIEVHDGVVLGVRDYLEGSQVI